MNTFADLLKEESKRFGGNCYCSWPYSCCVSESLIQARYYEIPGDRCNIIRNENLTTIEIKPRKGSRKRKLMIVKLWPF